MVDPKKPRFFCENCSAEVPRDGKKCPNCGRYFASVRCPACDFVGEEALFKGGCPVCGYSSTPVNGGKTRSRNDKKSAASLPFWIYILTAAVFTAVLAALFFVVIK